MSTSQSKAEPAAAEEFLIGVVGPCAAGKSTLIAGLTQLGYQARHIAQEHSYVSDMWQRIAKPDILIYLDVSYPVSWQRRPMDWSETEYQIQIDRLQHARRNAQLYIDTSTLTISEVLSRAIAYLKESNSQV